MKVTLVKEWEVDFESDSNTHTDCLVHGTASTERY
jgi:hypothetical protein